MNNSRILIVEDEPSIADFIKEFLEHHHYQVEVASDGTEGLKKASEGRYALLLLDVSLPGLTGFEICRRLRRTMFGFLTPIVMLTARNLLSDKLEGIYCGADDYITKPFPTHELLSRIQSVLERKEEYLLHNPFTQLPSFRPAERRFEELKGKEMFLILTSVEGFTVEKDYDYAKYKEEEILTKSLGHLIEKHFPGKDLFHFDRTNFVFFAAPEGLRQKSEAFLKEVSANKMNYRTPFFLNLVALDLSRRKETRLFDIEKTVFELRKNSAAADSLSFES